VGPFARVQVRQWYFVPSTAVPCNELLSQLAYKEMDSAFRALADPTRRDILRLLRDGPRTSGEIAQHFDAAWPTVSRHLAILREAKLVESTRMGQQIVYELNMSVAQEVVEHLYSWLQPGGRGD
jgi:DNA-binding transcriptional ArsR family regulator